MNEDRTFGIEIECHATVPEHRIADRIRQFFEDNQINHEVHVTGIYTHDTDESNTTIWKIKPDASVVTLNSQMARQFPHNMEIVSPVLKGAEGMRAVKVVCRALDDLTGSPFATASRTCGFHVHHYVGNESQEALVNVANAWLNDEKFFYFAVPNSRLTNSYCRQWSNVNPPRCSDDAIAWYRHNFRSLGDVDRRTSLNFHSYQMRKTLEWRLHSGTVEWPKISTWILITQRWLDLALLGGIVTNNRKTFKEFVESLKTTSLSVRRSIRRRLPRRSTSDDEADYERQFLRSAHSYMARRNFASKFVHPEAKKQRVPKPDKKAGAIIRLLLHGWIDKNAIVRYLDSEFGTLPAGKQMKFVSGQLTNMKNMKWGFGFNIVKRGKKFRLIPLEENITHVIDDPEPDEPEPAEEEMETVNMSNVTDEQEEAIRFFINRSQLFEGRRNPDNLGEYGFHEDAEEQQEHESGDPVV